MKGTILSSKKDSLKKLRQYKKRFLQQEQFPPFSNPYEDRIEPIMHTGYLLFIRSKFLFIGLLKSIDERNLYVSYALLKAYWENVAAFGYYFIRISALLKNGKKEEAFSLSRKMGMGGRGFLTKEMVDKKGLTLEDYTLPNIYTMIDRVDEDFKKRSGQKGNIMRELYDADVAEGGHTTYLGLSICGKWLPDKSLLPDVKKSWEKHSHGSILNNASLASTLFFFYWEKFEEIDS